MNATKDRRLREADRIRRETSVEATSTRLLGEIAATLNELVAAVQFLTEAVDKTPQKEKR